MISISELARRVLYFIRREHYASDLEEEMRLHRELRAQAMREDGMDARTADAEARRRFGNVTNMTERSRDMWGFGTLETFWQDIRFAVRRLRQRPAFSVPVITVLALGIGATTAVFSAVDAAMLRSLPFAGADRLVTLSRATVPFDFRRDDDEDGRLLQVTDVVQMTDVYSNAAAYAAGGINLTDAERPQRLRVGVVTTTFFGTLGGRPLLGRTFNADEGRPRGPAAVVLSYDLWQRLYGGQPVLESRIMLQGKSYAIVGIMPRDFNFPNESELWIPMSVPTTFATFEPFRGFLPSTVVARMRPGITVEEASALTYARWQQVATSSLGVVREGLQLWLANVREDGPAVPLQERLLGNNRPALLILMGATLLLLLIACANVANLLFSDAAVRRREIAVREVLGATRRRIVRQLLGESVLLSLAGAAIGVLLAPALLKVLRAMMPAALAGVSPAQLDLRVLGFAVLLVVFTSMLFGLWPAIGATRGDASDAIKSGGGHGATAGGLGKTRRVLVVAEVALTVMLLVAAGLMLRSFERLMAKDTGMRPEQVTTLETSFPDAVSPAERLRMQEAIIDRLSAQPGILAVGIVNDLPLRGGGGMSVTMTVPDAVPPPEGERHWARQLTASAGYFEALGIRLLRGRTFRPSDTDDMAPVAIISDATAKAWWPGRDPIGRTFSYRPDDPPMTVIGVVADVRERRMESEPTPQMYHSAYRVPPDNMALVVRGTLPSGAMMARMTEAVRAAAPTQAVYNVRTMEEVIGASVAPRRTNTILIALFAALALVLSGLGVYAVVAYGVAQRRREFGIRAALGATGRDLLGLVSREMVAVIALGLTIGLAAAWALSRVLASLLYEVDARDPATFVTVPLVLLLPAIVATLVPALRAMRVNPIEVMRAD